MSAGGADDVVSSAARLEARWGDELLACVIKVTSHQNRTRTSWRDEGSLVSSALLKAAIFNSISSALCVRVCARAHVYVCPFLSHTFLFPIEESVSQDPDCDKRGL